MERVHLIVGLGNPGREYLGTRHNAGFEVVEYLASRWKVEWKKEVRFEARLGWAQQSGVRCILCEPMTFMNCSGRSVQAVTGYFRIPVERVLVVVDDADLELGRLRLRPAGSSGGHHGLESLELALGTRDYARLRLGIGRREPAARQIAGHVLGRFGETERPVFGEAVRRAADAAECWLVAGLDLAMNRFNGAVTVPETKEN